MIYQETGDPPTALKIRVPLLPHAKPYYEYFMGVLQIASAPEYRGISVRHILTYQQVLGPAAFPDVQPAIQCVLAMDRAYRETLAQLEVERQARLRLEAQYKEQRDKEHTRNKPYYQK